MMIILPTKAGALSIDSDLSTYLDWQDKFGEESY